MMKKLLAMLLLLAMAITPMLAMADEIVNPPAEKKFPPPHVQESWFKDRKRPHRPHWNWTYPSLVAPDGTYVIRGPLVFGNKIVVTQQEEAKKEEPQYKRAVFGDITYSGEVLKQVWIINRSLDFRVYEGSIRHTFRETFGAGENGIRLTMVVDGHVTGLKPVYTEKALNYLRKQGVVEVLIKSDAEETLYTLDELYQGLNADASVDAG